MTNENKKAMGIAIVAGVLLLVAGLSGLAAWEDIRTYVTDNMGDNEAIQYVFVVLILIASLGGIAVIVGGLLIGKDKVGLGKFLITLGAGLGLIGFIISLVVGIMAGSLVIGGFLGIGAIGLILSIVARMMVKKAPKKSRKSKSK
jgi:hypothetical protein